MNPTTIHGIVYYLLSHQMRIKQELTDYTNQYDALRKDPNNSLFLDDINDQYNKMIKSHLINDVTKALGVTTEEAISVVEDLNIQEYLK